MFLFPITFENLWSSYFYKHFLIACDIGSYGDECKEICGNCNDVIKCSHINGTCLAGCEVGYHGYLCKEREWLTHLIKTRFILTDSYKLLLLRLLTDGKISGRSIS